MSGAEKKSDWPMVTFLLGFMVFVIIMTGMIIWAFK